MSTPDPDTQADDAAQHKAAMQKLQAEHRARLAEKQKAERGLILINTGDGKGKSTAAFGTMARALGWGHKCAVVQFIKGDWKTGEKQFFDRFPDQVDWHTMGEGFTWDTQDKSRDIATATRAWEKAKALIGSGDYDLVLLDEINVVLQIGYLPAATVIDGVLAHAKRTSIILTGRGAPLELIAIGDTVTEMQPVKHAFDTGIKAVPGLDY